MSLIRYFKLIPLIITTIICYLAVIEVLTSPVYINQSQDVTVTSKVTFGNQLIVGVLFSTISLILAIVKVKYWKHILAFTLLLGTLSIAKISNYTSVITIGFIGIQFSFEVYNLVILVAHLMLNLDFIKDLISELKNESTSEIQLNKPNIFETKFKDKRTHELEEIINDNFLSQEAIEAARQILKNRK